MKGVRLYYIPETREFVPAEKLPPRESGPVVIQDSCDPFLSHADGKIYESKSAYRRELKARGLVELGNDQIKPRAREVDRSIERDLAKVMREFNN